MNESNHLKDIYSSKKGAVNLQIVFSDIIDYSKRKSTIQKRIIDNFTKINQSAFEHLSKEYIKYAQENNINLDKDIIKIPTGDGLAVIFPFEGLPSIHLDFAKILLEKIYEHNTSNDCERFEDQGSCNCHDNFNLRIGLSEGKGIIYKDINNSYNVAGNVINMASRVMGLGDANSILVTEEAYNNIIDMTSEVTLEDDFEFLEDVKIKHGIKLNVYQYRPECDFINNETPKQIAELLAIRSLRQELSSVFPFPPEIENEEDKFKLIGEMMDGLKMMQNTMQTFGLQKPITEITSIKEDVKDKSDK